jgi:hypothetical protein
MRTSRHKAAGKNQKGEKGKRGKGEAEKENFFLSFSLLPFFLFPLAFGL